MKNKLNKIFPLLLLFLLIISPVRVRAAEGGNKLFEVTLEEFKNMEDYLNYEYERAFDVLDSLNKLRQSKGLNKLEMDRQLLEQAMYRSLETMVYFSHTRPNGGSCFTVYEDLGHTKRPWGENIAAGYGSPDSVMTGWINSPGHYNNMISTRWKSIGVGSVANRWVQLFSDEEAEIVRRSDYPKKRAITSSVMVSVDMLQFKQTNHYLSTFKPEEIMVYGDGEFGFYPLDKDQLEYRLISGKANIKDHTIEARGQGEIKLEVLHRPSGKKTIFTYQVLGTEDPARSEKKGWVKENGKWYYSENTWKQIYWKNIKGKWYYFGKDYYMKTGWIKSGGKWYYLGPSGDMYRNRWIGGKYYVGDSGAMYENSWTPDGYYVKANGQWDKNKYKPEGRF